MLRRSVSLVALLAAVVAWSLASRGPSPAAPARGSAARGDRAVMDLDGDPSSGPPVPTVGGAPVREPAIPGGDGADAAPAPVERRDARGRADVVLVLRPIVEGRAWTGPLRARLSIRDDPDGRSESVTRFEQSGAGDDGTFALRADDVPWPAGRARLDLSVGDLARPHEDRPHVRTLDLTGRLAPGANDLGAVVLVASPVSLRGRVVDDRGEPRPGARVTIARRVPWTERSRHVEGCRLSPVRKRDGMALVPTFETVADARGRFAVHVPIEGEPALHVHAEASDHAPSRVVPIVGTSRDVVLTTPRLGAARVRVLLDPGVRPDDVRVDVDGRVGSRLPAAEGIVGGLPPGRVRLAFRLDADDALLGTADLLVPAGGTARDAALEPLDLRVGASVLEVEVRDPFGAPVPSAVVTLVGADGDEEVGETDGAGRFRRAGRWPPVDARVAGPDGGSVPARPLVGTATVVVARAPAAGR
ncbi:MAG: hypothetical protein ACF8XB_17645 [Planctomycetota bacterium JB042]